MEQRTESPFLAIAIDDRFQDHVAPGFHPERPERLIAARRGLESLNFSRFLVPTRLATGDELHRVHAPAYIDALQRALGGGQGFLDGDTFFSAGTHEAAWRAAGTACALVDTLMADDRPGTGVLLARPPGHHATRDRAMGFCLINNVAVAAAHARSRGLERVAIVDWDVHHGNGTQDIFERDPNVLFVSLHQSPLYPGTGSASETGTGAGLGRTVNVPLPPGTGGSAYRAAFERLVLPIVSAFQPSLLLVSAGFDAHERDPLGGMRVDTGTFGWMGAELGTLARTLGHGRIGMFLEGGYDLRALEESVAAAAGGAMAGRSTVADRTEVLSPEVETALRLAMEAQRPYWRGTL